MKDCFYIQNLRVSCTSYLHEYMILTLQNFLKNVPSTTINNYFSSDFDANKFRLAYAKADAKHYNKTQDSEKIKIYYHKCGQQHQSPKPKNHDWAIRRGSQKSYPCAQQKQGNKRFDGAQTMLRNHHRDQVVLKGLTIGSP